MIKYIRCTSLGWFALSCEQLWTVVTSNYGDNVNMHIFYSRRFPIVPAGVVKNVSSLRLFPTIHNFRNALRQFATSENTMLWRLFCEHATAHNYSQPFPTNVNTPMRTPVHNYSRLFTTVHNSMWTSLYSIITFCYTNNTWINYDWSIDY